MHQSVIVKGAKGAFKLLVIGGKSELGAKGWLNTVESLDLTWFLFPHLKKDKKNATFDIVQWEKLAPL